LLLLSGEATSRNEQIVVTFGGSGTPTRRDEERGAVPRRPGLTQAEAAEEQAEGRAGTGEGEESRDGHEGTPTGTQEAAPGTDGDGAEGCERPVDSVDSVDSVAGGNGDSVDSVEQPGQASKLPQASGGSFVREDGVLVIRHGVQIPRSEGRTMAERRANAATRAENKG